MIMLSLYFLSILCGEHVIMLVLFLPKNGSQTGVAQSCDFAVHEWWRFHHLFCNSSIIFRQINHCRSFHFSKQITFSDFINRLTTLYMGQMKLTCYNEMLLYQLFYQLVVLTFKRTIVFAGSRGSSGVLPHLLWSIISQMLINIKLVHGILLALALLVFHFY